MPELQTVCCCAASDPPSLPSPQCRGTRCQLCRHAASGPSSLPSHTGPWGRAAHSVTARGVDCAGVLLPARLPFCHSLGSGVGWPTSVATAGASRLARSSLVPTRPSRCHRHANSDTKIRSGRSVRQPLPAHGPGCTLCSCTTLVYFLFQPCVRESLVPVWV